MMNFNSILGMGKNYDYSVTNTNGFHKPNIKKVQKMRVITPDDPNTSKNLCTREAREAHFNNYKDEILQQYDKPFIILLIFFIF